MGSTLKKRIYKFDNVKFLAILLVVTGHAIETVARDRGESDLFLCLYTFIYTFHMPLFIFISGLFTKKINKTDKFNIANFTFYIITGFLLKAYRVIINKICSPDKVYLSHRGTSQLMGTSSIEWFMFVLAFCVLFVYLLRRVRPYITIPLSIVCGCLIGFVDFYNIGPIVYKQYDFLYLSRLFVYFPFFLIGYYLTPKNILDFTSKLYVKIPSIIILIGYFILCFRIGFSDYISLYTGRNPYSKLTDSIPGCSVQHRLMAYLVSAILIIGVISLIPNVKIPAISHMGENTLGVYFWHNPLIKLLNSFGLYAFFKTFGDPMWKILILVFAVALTMVLSLDIFSWPFKKVRKLCISLKPTAAYALCIMLFAGSILAFYFFLK